MEEKKEEPFDLKEYLSQKKSKIKRKDYNAAAVEILKHLNEVCNKNFRIENTDNLRKIKARLLQGYTVRDLANVIENMRQATERGEFPRRYLRPKTLFLGENIDTYLEGNSD